MRSGRASRTAEQNALFRALETHRPSGERLVDDPLAEALLSRRYRLVAELARWHWWRSAVCTLIDRRWPGVRTTVLARTCVLDGLVDDIAPTTPQVVVLGAGLDTRSWRLPVLEDVTPFEVDHPDTQRRKQLVLLRHDLDVARVRFVPSDFNLGRLDSAMSRAGYDPAIPTLFLWEGTTNYLSADAVDGTLRWCARAAAGSQLVFTYIDEDVLDDPSRYVGAERVFATVERADEPMTFGLAPAALPAYLAARGLQLVTDEGAASFRRRWYGTASEAMHGHEFYRVAHARVASANVAPTVELASS